MPKMDSTKIALITDAHGNLPALRAALKAIHEVENCDSIYHLGDAIGIGPSPVECLELILDVPNLNCIVGNHEQYYLQGIPTAKFKNMPAGELRQHKWVHQQLGEHRKLPISKWEQVINCNIQGLKIRFQHYGFSKNGQGFAKIIREPTAADLNQLFENVDADIIFFGHAHEKTDIKGNKHYINPSSLGCNPEAVAKYTIVEFKNGQINCSHRETQYDDVELFAAFEERKVPNREIVYESFFGGRFKKYETYR